MKCFVFDAFKDFKDVLFYKHDIISLRCIAFKIDFNVVNVEYLVFQLVKTNSMQPILSL
jgi:hypothetical protein